MKKKAVEYIKQDSPRRGKQQFFNILNETLAYKFLLDRGFRAVRFFPASDQRPRKNKVTAPDIQFQVGNETSFCEVKTIAISEEELDRADLDEIGSGAVYSTLSNGVLKKLSDDIFKATSQIPTESINNLVYVIVHFDEFFGFHYKEYERAIRHHLRDNHDSVQIYLRVGLHEQFSIHHKPREAQP